MLHQRVLHLDRRDVLAAADDDVLLAVAELDVAVGMHDAEVARVEPAARERLRGRLGIAEVALHHVVAAHHDLADRRAVGGHVAQLVVDDAQVHGVVERHALPRHHPRAALDVERLPLALHLAVDVGPVGLGEAVEVGHAHAERVHAREERRRGRRAARGDAERRVEVDAARLRRLGEHQEHRRRAVQVRDALLADEAQDRRGVDARAASRACRPRPSPPTGSTSRCSGTSGASRGRRVSRPRPWTNIAPSAFSEAPRWVYMTPFGRPVVPEV